MEENGVEYYPLNCVDASGEEIVEGGTNTIADVGFIQIVNELGSNEVIEIHQGFDGEVVDAIFVACPPDKCGEGLSDGTLKCTIASDDPAEQELYASQTVLRQGQHLAEGQITLCHVDGADSKGGQKAIFVQDPNVPGGVSTVIFMPANKSLSSSAPENEKLMQLARVAQCAKSGTLLTDQDIGGECVDVGQVGEYLSEEGKVREVSELHVLNEQCEEYAEEYFEGCGVDKEVTVIRDIASMGEYQVENEVNGSMLTDQNVYVVEQGYHEDGVHQEEMSCPVENETLCSVAEDGTMYMVEDQTAYAVVEDGSHVVEEEIHQTGGEESECTLEETQYEHETACPVEGEVAYPVEDEAYHVENEDALPVENEDALPVENEDACPVENEDALPVENVDSYPVEDEDAYGVEDESACPVEDEDACPVEDDYACPVDDENACMIDKSDVIPQNSRDGYELQASESEEQQVEQYEQIQNITASSSRREYKKSLQEITDSVSMGNQLSVIKESTFVKQIEEAIDENMNVDGEQFTAQSGESVEHTQISGEIEDVVSPKSATPDEEHSEILDKDENVQFDDVELKEKDESTHESECENIAETVDETDTIEPSLEDVETEDKIESQDDDDHASLEHTELIDDASNEAQDTGIEGDIVENVLEPIMKPPKKTYARTCKLLKEQFTDDNEKKVASIESDLKLLSSSDALSFSCDGLEETSDVEDSTDNVDIVISVESTETESSPVVSKKRTRTSSKPAESPAAKRNCHDNSKPEITTVDPVVESVSDTQNTRRSARKRKSEFSSVPKTNEEDKPDDNDDKEVASSATKKRKLVQKVAKGKSSPYSATEKTPGDKFTKVKLSNKSSKWFYKKSNTGRKKNYDPSSEYIFTDSDDSSNDFGTPSFSGYSPSKKRGRPIGSRNKLINNNRTWDRLLQSSPSKIKTTNYLSKLKRRYARTNGGTSSHSSVRVDDLEQSLSTVRTSNRLSRKELSIRYMEQPPTTVTEKPSSYTCFICQYETERIQTFIYHTKSCMSTSATFCLNEVTDMDKRQRIRGEFGEDSQSSSNTQEEDVYLSNSVLEEMEDDDSSTEGAEFRENDVVWVERKAGLWPGWIRQVYAEENQASVYLIDFPNKRNVDMKVPFKKLTNFHDADQNKKFLSEGKTKLNGEHFIKAVQQAELFIRKRVLGVPISATAFFTKGQSDIIKSIEGTVRSVEEIAAMDIDQLADPLKK